MFQINDFFIIHAYYYSEIKVNRCMTQMDSTTITKCPLLIFVQQHVIIILYLWYNVVNFIHIYTLIWLYSCARRI